MDALKIISEGSIKAEKPQFNVGDTVGIERVFPINSPFVEKVTVVRKGKVRRAKLFYLRGRTGKAAKVKSDI